MSASHKKIADALLKIGRKNVPQDTRLVYVNEPEYAALVRHSGPGEPDKTTGIEHFDESDGDSNDNNGVSDSTDSSVSEETSSWASEQSEAAAEMGGVDAGAMAANAEANANAQAQAEAAALAAEQNAPGLIGDKDSFVSFGLNPAAQAAHDARVNEDIASALGYDPSVGYSDPNGLGSLFGQSRQDALARNQEIVEGAPLNFAERSSNWINQNKGVVNTVNGLVGMVNPMAGGLLSLGSNIASGQSGRGVGQALGSLSGPLGSMAGGLIGSQFDNGRMDAVSDYFGSEAAHGTDSGDSGNASSEDQQEIKIAPYEPPAAPVGIPVTPAYEHRYGEYIPSAPRSPRSPSVINDGQDGAGFAEAPQQDRSWGPGYDSVDFLERQKKEAAIQRALMGSEGKQKQMKIPTIDDYLAGRY